MAFLLEIEYASGSAERLFLARGWGGVRDVRGPYVANSPAMIELAPWALSLTNVSQADLVFGLSNRSPVDALMFKVSGLFGDVSCMIKRNMTTAVTIPDIILPETGVHYSIAVVVDVPVSFTGVGIKFFDILSIDRLRISRNG
jgi:hypothetical protein